MIVIFELIPRYFRLAILSDPILHEELENFTFSQTIIQYLTYHTKNTIGSLAGL